MNQGNIASTHSVDELSLSFVVEFYYSEIEKARISSVQFIHILNSTTYKHSLN